MKKFEFYSLDEARALAEARTRDFLKEFFQSEKSLQKYLTPGSPSALSEEYIEERNCFVFFVNDEIKKRVPTDVLHTGQEAYAVIKLKGYARFGKVDPIRFIPDVRNNRPAMMRYLREFSDYVGRNVI